MEHFQKLPVLASGLVAAEFMEELEKLGVTTAEAFGGFGPLYEFVSAIVTRYEKLISKVSILTVNVTQVPDGEQFYSLASVNSRNSCKMLAALASLGFDTTLRQGFRTLAAKCKHNLARVMFSGENTRNFNA